MSVSIWKSLQGRSTKTVFWINVIESKSFSKSLIRLPDIMSTLKVNWSEFSPCADNVFQ